MSPRGLGRNVRIMGESVPLTIAILAGLVLGLSILGAVGVPIAGAPLLYWAALSPALVFPGWQVWRLFTWVLFATDPLGLVFGCLGLWWFGAPLIRAWGHVRFLRICFFIVGLSALLTCLLAIPWHALGRQFIVSPWPLLDAFIISFASISPNSTVLLYFVLPVQGRSLIYLTIGTTVIFAIFGGITPYVPHLFAEGLAFLYVGDTGIKRLWLSLRLSQLERSMRRRHSPLREVRRSDPPRWFH